MGLTGCGVHLGALVQDGLVKFLVALLRGHKPNRTVVVLVVVPVHQLKGLRGTATGLGAVLDLTGTPRGERP